MGKIADKIDDKRIHSFWKQPKKARDLATLLGFSIFLLGLALFMVISIADIQNNFGPNSEEINHLIGNIDCDILKKLLQEDSIYSFDIQRHIIARC